jgi:hypothetical protein
VIHTVLHLLKAEEIHESPAEYNALRKGKGSGPCFFPSCLSLPPCMSPTPLSLFTHRPSMSAGHLAFDVRFDIRLASCLDAAFPAHPRRMICQFSIHQDDLSLGALGRGYRGAADTSGRCRMRVR